MLQDLFNLVALLYHTVDPTTQLDIKGLVRKYLKGFKTKKVCDASYKLGYTYSVPPMDPEMACTDGWMPLYLLGFIA